jgi:tetraacyldisaccharide 4'-kinase
VRFRNFCYDKKWFKSYSVDIPVISIGNLTAGGTGKTPLVIWLCNLLETKMQNCAILTRGYKTEPGILSDEPAILAKSCPSAKIIVNPDRLAGAEKAIKENDASVLVMDDGFQHRKLKRDLDIVTIDATCPFGCERILPAGLLREPLTTLKRAHIAVITRSDLLSQDKLKEIEEKIQCFNPDIIITKAAYKHPGAIAIKGTMLTIEELKEKSIFAFCGIANPNAFFTSLEKMGMNLLGSKIYNDHHNYSDEDISDIYEEARYLGAELILLTQKDWVKTALLAQKNEDIIFAYLVLELDFPQGSDTIETLIDKSLN